RIAIGLPQPTQLMRPCATKSPALSGTGVLQAPQRGAWLPYIKLIVAPPVMIVELEPSSIPMPGASSTASSSRFFHCSSDIALARLHEPHVKRGVHALTGVCAPPPAQVILSSIATACIPRS